jgi:hypothetical protein
LKIGLCIKYFFKSPKKRIIRVCLNQIGSMSLLWQKRMPRNKHGSVEECENEHSHSQMNFHCAWELESRWTLETSESDWKGQNPFPWGIIYIIGKLLKCRCPKWACMTHLDICNTSYGQKKGRESNWQFDFRPRKVENRPDSLVCKWRATCHWKALEEGYNLSSDLIPIEGLHKKLWTRKVVGVPTLAISDTTPAGRCRVYYMGEGGGFPRVWAVVSLVSPRSPVAHPNTKGVPTLC